MTDILDELATTHTVSAVPIHGDWVEIDTPRDLDVAEARWAGSAAPPAPIRAA
jgi:NDP-sugar pyrophosphorylase family protein